MSDRKKRLFSGIQPTGEIHIGNWLGAVKNWVELQHAHDAIYCIVDYHAITAPYERAEMPRRILDAATWIMACGVEPGRARLFVQSEVPEHTELAWVLASVTPMGELQRMTQFKEKSRQHEENINAGLFTYPVLQTADIVLYKAELVPVGEDQVQHLELAREVVRDFNRRYGDTFPEPQAFVGKARRIIGLDGDDKMSKSKGNTIALGEPRAAVWEKLRVAKTDPARLRRADPGTPEKCNIWTLHTFLTEDAAERQRCYEGCKTAAIGCIDCKRVLDASLDRALAPIRARHAELAARPERVRELLDASAADCRAIARETMREVRDRLGVGVPRERA